MTRVTSPPWPERIKPEVPYTADDFHVDHMFGTVRVYLRNRPRGTPRQGVQTNRRMGQESIEDAVARLIAYANEHGLRHREELEEFEVIP